METRLNALKLYRRHFFKLQFEIIQILVTVTVPDRTEQNRLVISAIFGNSAKFVEIESALEIYTTNRNSHLVSNATNETQFGLFYTKIQQF